MTKKKLTPKLHITDERMLQAMEYCLENEVKGIKRGYQWLEAIGASPANIGGIRNGAQGFTKAQILAAYQVFGISPLFVFGISGEMFAEKESLSPIERIKEAIWELEMKSKSKTVELKPKKRAV